MNITDEINHDIALQYVADAYAVDEKATAEAQASQKLGSVIQTIPLSKRWYLSEVSSSLSSLSSELLETLV